MQVKGYYYLLTFFILTAFVGFRNRIGFDWQNYEEVFISQKIGAVSPQSG